jgi:hypothetical protein
MPRLPQQLVQARRPLFGVESPPPHDGKVAPVEASAQKRDRRKLLLGLAWVLQDDAGAAQAQRRRRKG